MQYSVGAANPWRGGRRKQSRLLSQALDELAAPHLVFIVGNLQSQLPTSSLNPLKDVFL